MTNIEQVKEIFGIPETPLEKAKIVVVPVPWEGTVSYGIGTSKAPQAILNASEQIDLFDLDVRGIDKLGFCSLPIDKEQFRVHYHDAFPEIETVNNVGIKINEYVYNNTMSALKKNQIPAIVGGEHSVSFGAIEAASKKVPLLDILHIDAHMDMRNAYEGYTWSHASIMFNVASRVANINNIVQVGIRDFCEEELNYVQTLNQAADRNNEIGGMLSGVGKINPKVWTHFDQKLARDKFNGKCWSSLVENILEPLQENVWVTIDVDGLNPNWCPSTGTPVPGGLEYNELVFLLKELASSGRKILGFDIVEVGNSEWDANVGMRLLYKMSGLAAASQGILEWR